MIHKNLSNIVTSKSDINILYFYWNLLFTTFSNASFAINKVKSLFLYSFHNINKILRCRTSRGFLIPDIDTYFHAKCSRVFVFSKLHVADDQLDVAPLAIVVDKKLVQVIF